MKTVAVVAASLIAYVSADTCAAKSAIEAWPSPVNEPCYIHGGTCSGGQVCCVKAGTCKSLGGMVSSTTRYYEGHCYSDKSSRNATAPGCQGKVGECNNYLLNNTMGQVASSTSLVNPVPDAAQTRMEGSNFLDEPCNGNGVDGAWNVITASLTLTNDYSDLVAASHYGPPGPTDKANAICQRIGEAAGLTYGHRKWVICSYTAGSTIIDAVINLPSTISPDKAMSNLKTNIGTVAKAGTFLSQNAHVQTDYSSYGPGYSAPTDYAVVVADGQTPTMTMTVGSLKSEGGLSTTSLIIIIVAAVLVVVLLGVAVMLKRKKKAAASSSTAKI